MVEHCALGKYAAAYEQGGFVSAVPIFGPERAGTHRCRLEEAERRFGPLHYVSKVHTIFTDAAALATDSRVLDVVEALIGPNILLFDSTYIIKEARTGGHVSWHQDLTYWGFSGTDQVSMWLALSPATLESGCMRMVPGSHRAGRLNHIDCDDPSNLLHRGQTVPEVSESAAVMCALISGEASFHHGWTLHASMPNLSPDRRVGLNAQYIAPSMKQLVNTRETALLVRGQDQYGHYGVDRLAESDFESGAVARHQQLDRLRKATWDQAAIGMSRT